MTESPHRRVRGVHDLSQEIAPPRDLWPGIATAIASASESAAPTNSVARRSSVSWWPIAVAASVTVLAVAAWFGRGLKPGVVAHTGVAASQMVARGAAPSAEAALPLAASFALDAKSSSERQQRLNRLASQLAALPPQTRLKVSMSLGTIEQSMRDIQAALGLDPGNLLLQEMLVNSYQDEMRVLGEVDEANTMTLERRL